MLWDMSFLSGIQIHSTWAITIDKKLAELNKKKKFVKHLEQYHKYSLFSPEIKLGLDSFCKREFVKVMKAKTFFFNSIFVKYHTCNKVIH